MSTQEKKGLFARLIAYMIANKPDLLFKILRTIKPNLVPPGDGPVFITRFRDVQEALSRPEVFRVTYRPMMDPSVGPFMLGYDGSVYNQRDKGIMRSLIRKEDMQRVKEIVSRLAQEAVDAAAKKGEMEVVSELSRMVPVLLTCEYFGFPGPDTPTMFRWSRATQYDMFHNIERDEAIHQDNIKAGQEMQRYLKDVLIPRRREELRENPEQDDVLSRLLKSSFPDAVGFDEQRIVSNTIGTLVGGIETTSQAIVQILDQLFKRPEIFREAVQAARDDNDDLLLSYCWEALRFNPINPFVVRQCAQEYTIAAGSFRSAKIPKGRLVLVCTRSAMRDGRELCCPGDFVIDRPDYHYMHMGYGSHTCLGDQVSRVQVPQIVKRLLLRPNLHPKGDIDFKGGPFPEKYVVAFD
jgi:cytochrome P450